MRGEWPPFFRNELRKQVGLSGRDQFLHLLFWNFAMQNRFADAESAGLLFRDGILARIRAIEHVDLSFLTNGTEPERFVFRGVDRHRLVMTVLAKIERGLEI